MPNKHLRSSPRKGCFQARSLPSHKPLHGQSRSGSSTQSKEHIDQKSGEGGMEGGGFNGALPLVWNGVGVSQSQILVTVQRSHGVGHCSSDSPNLG